MSPVDGSATAEAPPPPPAAAAADGAAASADPVAKPSMQPRVYQLELLELAKNRNVSGEAMWISQGTEKGAEGGTWPAWGPP